MVREFFPRVRKFAEPLHIEPIAIRQVIFEAGNIFLQFMLWPSCYIFLNDSFACFTCDRLLFSSPMLRVVVAHLTIPI